MVFIELKKKSFRYYFTYEESRQHLLSPFVRAKDQERFQSSFFSPLRLSLTSGGQLEKEKNSAQVPFFVTRVQNL